NRLVNFFVPREASWLRCGSDRYRLDSIANLPFKFPARASRMLPTVGKMQIFSYCAFVKLAHRLLM
ncbi:MAG TPA: hypothetical protein VL017_10255, partial [Devosia sp.]|nr:hypothetical protein [Devosia sp.]